MADVPRENMPSLADPVEARKRLRAQIKEALPNARTVLRKAGKNPDEEKRATISIAADKVRDKLKSEVDELTEIWGLNGFNRRGKEEIERSKRLHYKVAVVILDMNFLKETNETESYDAGSAKLKKVAECLASATRETDTVARWGGDEFGAVLANTDQAGAKLWWDRVNFLFQQNNISIGAGLAIVNPDDLTTHDNWEEKFNEYKNLAEKPLHLAKEMSKKPGGRNTLITYEEWLAQNQSEQPTET